MLKRNLLILLLPLTLMACHPKEAAVTDAKKASLTKEEKIQKEEVKEDATLVCPIFTELKDGQCLCYGEPIGLADSQSWICLDEAWMCAAVGGCKHGAAVCGFGGRLRDGICHCDNTSTDETMLGDYLCQNDFWICDKQEGCGKGDEACAYGETCFKPVASCFGVELTQDLSKYRCEDKLWTCRHTEGCRCGAALVPFGTHCRDNEAYCDTLPKPEKDNYKCVGACVPQLTNSAYYWICQNLEGCLCEGEQCGYGASCGFGECYCGEDEAPAAMAQYRCYSERRIGIINDTIESLGYWICNHQAGCNCGDKVCAMGESCMPDGKCANRDPNRPKYYEDFVYENAHWTCPKPEGCRCGETLCGNGKFCDQGQCSCDGVLDCSQRACSNGKCTEALSCGAVDAPKRPGYLCEKEAWICRNDKACFCGIAFCSPGAECRQGQCLCGSADNPAPPNLDMYICDAGQWKCNDSNGCICGSSFAPRGSTCRNDAVYCGDTPVKDGKGYYCEEVNGKSELRCGYYFQTAACLCGDHFCPFGTVCKNDQCLCGDKVTPSFDKAVGYVCESGEFLCGQDACQCGENGCGVRGRCENDRCVCGPKASVAPKDATVYACYHYEGDNHYVESWICESNKACRCGETFCGPGGACDADKSCRCNGTLAPILNPEKYTCDGIANKWLCSDENGCPFSGGICPQGHLLDKNTCIKPSESIKEALSAQSEAQADQDDFCLGNKRPLKGDYRCEDIRGTGLGSDERSGWKCTKAEGCPCGDETNADICRSSCLRSDDNDLCLEYTWYGQYLPICDGMWAIGNDETCVDACPNHCNGLEKPSTPGYSCDKRAWVCTAALCTCHLSPCPKGHYCIDDVFCTR